MTSKEKQVCIECGDYKNCPYVSRNLEHKCQHLSDIMYGFELGHKDAIDKACEWLEHRQVIDLVVPNIEKFINDFRKAMEQ